MRTFKDMCLVANALESTKSERDSIRTATICTAIDRKRRCSTREAQHSADNVGSVDVPGSSVGRSVNPFSTDWLAVEIDMSAINACVGALQCNGACNVTFIGPRGPLVLPLVEAQEKNIRKIQITYIKAYMPYES